jgi:hypothetical protein
MYLIFGRVVNVKKHWPEIQEYTEILDTAKGLLADLAKEKQ